MNQKELKEILSNFSANSGAQLKYYIITSLFPNANKAEIKSIGEFNDQSFSRIERAVRDLGIKPLAAADIVEADSITKEVKDEATNWETKYNQFADAASQREMALLSEINNLKSANEKAAYDAVSYLISIGHRKIGMVSTEGRAPSSVEREAGYIRALKEHNIEFDEKYIFRDSYDYTSGMKATEYFMRMENKPTAVFAVSDFLAAGVIKKGTETGINIGREFSVIGFDNISMTEMYTPSITTIEQPCFDIGKTVAKLVIENITGGSNKGRVFLNHRLVCRQSTENVKKNV